MLWIKFEWHMKSARITEWSDNFSFKNNIISEKQGKLNVFIVSIFMATSVHFWYTWTQFQLSASDDLFKRGSWAKWVCRRQLCTLQFPLKLVTNFVPRRVVPPPVDSKILFSLIFCLNMHVSIFLLPWTILILFMHRIHVYTLKKPLKWFRVGELPLLK